MMTDNGLMPKVKAGKIKLEIDMYSPFPKSST